MARGRRNRPIVVRRGRRFLVQPQPLGGEPWGGLATPLGKGPMMVSRGPNPVGDSGTPGTHSQRCGCSVGVGVGVDVDVGL
jgi:hypothetical protein